LNDSADRFTSFVSAQSFAAFLAAMYCILLFARPVKAWIRLATLAALSIAAVLNGSRIWGISMFLATFLAVVLSGGRRNAKILGSVASCLLLLTLFAFRESLFATIVEQSAENRIAGAIADLVSGDDRGTGLGTLRFRKAIDDLAIRQIGESSPSQLVFGHGTTNAAAVTGSLFTYYYTQGERMDPNRMLHNEWLRVVYEWGLLGSALWLGFVGSVCALAWKRSRQRNGEAAKALCVYLPGFLFALGGENILAGAGNAVNMGFLLLVALAYTPAPDILARPTRKAGTLLQTGGVYESVPPEAGDEAGFALRRLDRSAVVPVEWGVRPGDGTPSAL
jgi:hypothetical protein